MEAKFDEKGREIPDQTPVEMPANARRPESMQDMIARLVSAKVDQVAADNGYGSWEEEDDFTDPEEAVIEPHSEHYISDVEMSPFEGSSETLDGDLQLPQGEEAPQERNPRTGAKKPAEDAPEAPQEKQEPS